MRQDIGFHYHTKGSQFKKKILKPNGLSFFVIGSLCVEEQSPTVEPNA